jgi:cation transport ATPase
VRLDPRFRASLYAVFALLTVTGVVWLLADWRKDPLAPDLWQEIAPLMLMLHGGAAMAALMLLGALVPLHVRRAWRSGRNRLTGPTMVAVNAVLIATAFGLYYAGSDTLRPWISDLHIVVGIVLPLALLVHVWRGRRTRQRISRRSGHWSADEDMRQQMRVPIPQERNTL